MTRLSVYPYIEPLQGAVTAYNFFSGLGKNVSFGKEFTFGNGIKAVSVNSDGNVQIYLWNSDGNSFYIPGELIACMGNESSVVDFEGRTVNKDSQLSPNRIYCIKNVNGSSLNELACELDSALNSDFVAPYYTCRTEGGDAADAYTPISGIFTTAALFDNESFSDNDGKDVFKLMVGEMLENGLEGELDDELGYSKYDYRNKEGENSRNGYSKKTLKTSFGETEIKVPRDRDGEFEPQLVKKNQTTLTGDIEEKILSMYAKGMTTSDIETHIQDIYGLECSDSTISRITDKILPVVREWQSRPLEEVYAVVFMDAIHFHVRSEGQIVKKAVYIAIGINMDGMKEVLGMWVGENESAKFWLSVMNGLKNRGLQDILIACVDGLTGFPAAIEAVYPKTEIQQCIIHQIRNTTKFVSYKDIKALMSDLKKVYAAIDEQTALSELENFDEKWGNKYPKIAISWRDNWANLSTYFKYPQEVRTLIYTTNAIEGFNRQLRKVTKNKGVFPTDDSLLKMLYLAMMDITKKWTGKRREWGQIHSQLEIFFADRLS